MKEITDESDERKGRVCADWMKVRKKCIIKEEEHRSIVPIHPYISVGKHTEI